MPDRTPIQWTDATWNPVRGCSRVSEGCRNCYAEQIAARFSGPGRPFEGFAVRRGNGDAQWTGKMALVLSHLADPLRWRRPRRVFVNSMSDLFHENLPFEAIDVVFAVMSLATQHTFQVLTKRPARMLEYFERVRQISRELDPHQHQNEWGDSNGFHATDCEDERVMQALERVEDEPPVPLPLPNVWLGVSVENQKAADERISLLMKTPAAVRFISAEPLLGSIDITNAGLRNAYSFPTRVVDGAPVEWTDPGAKFIGLDWVIVGGESGHRARPFDIQWARDIIEQCEGAGVACFVKQLGRVVHWNGTQGGYGDGPSNVWPRESGSFTVPGGFRKHLVDSHGGDWSEWPADLRIREFPKAAV